ncbi:hypothetical protein [Paenibacillus polymyxa]|uniref:hypothetical protein n=1 Tax=Paenibacillus polymyxa TaxID=1406 RepID=UPI001319FCB4|nr:hypothetical protein [Paenibacillus polymyxa]
MISITNLKDTDLEFDQQNRIVITNDEVNRIIKVLATDSEQEKVKIKGVHLTVDTIEIS